MSSSALRWGAFAVAGLIVALAVAFLATRMVSERIGISAEPVTAGASLSVHKQGGRGGRDTTAPATPTVPTAPTGPSTAPHVTPPPKTDDYSSAGSKPGGSDDSSHSGNSGGGRGGDD